MPRLRDLPLVAAAVAVDASFSEATEALFRAESPAIAVIDAAGRVAGIVTEHDILRAVFPGYLVELRHTAFLPDDPAGLDRRRREAGERPVTEFARPVEPLSADESQTHAAERFLHTGEPALPVVDGDRFLGMLSVAALCRGRTVDDPDA
jgi:CBS domain-containing protein